MTLDLAPTNTRFKIHSCRSTRLQEIGFTEGEHIEIIARAAFRGPIAVKVGCSVFALRLEEAEQIKLCEL